MSFSASRDPADLPCTLIVDFLSPDECQALIAQLEAAGIGATAALYPPSYRNNDRLVLDDSDLAARLYARIAAHAPETLVEPAAEGDGQPTIWRRERLNPRFRCCRYRDGQSFTIHRDGEYHAGPRERSRLTFMIYLNDGSEFSGGATRYYRDRSGQELLRSVTPRRGACIVFDHALWHDGEAVFHGTKYVLRSDVIYRAIGEPARAPNCEPVRHLGYIWNALRLADDRLASAGRDQTVRIFRIAEDDELHEMQILRGHDSSVACLGEARGALWSGDRTGHLLRWRSDGNRYQLENAFAAHAGAVLACERYFDPQFGECLATSGADGAIRLFSDAQTAVREIFGHRGWVWTLAVQREILFSGGEDGTVRRTSPNATDAQQIDLGAPIHALCVDEDRLLVGLGDGRLMALDARTLHPIAERRAHQGSVRCLRRLADGRIASGGEDDRVVLWRADLRDALHHQRHSDFVRAIVELPSGALLSASYDGTLRRFSA